MGFKRKMDYGPALGQITGTYPIPDTTDDSYRFVSATFFSVGGRFEFLFKLVFLFLQIVFCNAFLQNNVNNIV